MHRGFSGSISRYAVQPHEAQRLTRGRFGRGDPAFIVHVRPFASVKPLHNAFALPHSADRSGSPEVLDQHEVSGVDHTSRIEHGRSVRRHGKTQQIYGFVVKLLQPPEESISARIGVHQVKRRIGARITRHVVDALRSCTKGCGLDACHELARRASREREGCRNSDPACAAVRWDSGMFPGADT
jgi:hypothetical protein